MRVYVNISEEEREGADHECVVQMYTQNSAIEVQELIEMNGSHICYVTEIYEVEQKVDLWERNTYASVTECFRHESLDAALRYAFDHTSKKVERR